VCAVALCISGVFAHTAACITNYQQGGRTKDVNTLEVSEMHISPCYLFLKCWHAAQRELPNAVLLSWRCIYETHDSHKSQHTVSVLRL
jgi:hypothetical protein